MNIKKIILEPGSRVQAGDLILVLEDQQIKADIENIQDQLALKKIVWKKITWQRVPRKSI